MKLNAKKNIAAANTQQATEFKMNMDANAVKILTSKLYTKKTLAVVRELMANCIDATIMADHDSPINPAIIIAAHSVSFVDNGNGMSHDFITKMYSTFFQSDKKDSNEVTGAFGLGSKSPFAMTDQFRVYTTTKEDLAKGSTRVYQCALGTNGLPSIHTIGEAIGETSANTGTSVVLPITLNHVELASTLEMLMPVIIENKISIRLDIKLEEQYAFNDIKKIIERIENSTMENVPGTDFKVLLNGTKMALSVSAIERHQRASNRASNSGGDYIGSNVYNNMYVETYGQYGLYISMGSAVYAITDDLMQEVYGSNAKERKMIMEFMNFFYADSTKDRVVYPAAIGSFDLPPSRESIEITHRTKKFFQTTFIQEIGKALKGIHNTLCSTSMENFPTQTKDTLRPLRRMELIAATTKLYTGYCSHTVLHNNIREGLTLFGSLRQDTVRPIHPHGLDNARTMEYILVPVKWRGSDKKLLRKNKYSYSNFTANWNFGPEDKNKITLIFSDTLTVTDIKQYVTDTLARMLQTDELKHTKFSSLTKNDERIQNFVDNSRLDNCSQKDFSKDTKPKNLLRTKRLKPARDTYSTTTINWASHYFNTSDRDDILTGEEHIFENDVPYFIIDNNGSTKKTSYDSEGTIDFLQMYGDEDVIKNVTIYRVTVKQMKMYNRRGCIWKPIYDLVFDTLIKNRSKIITHAAMHSVAQVAPYSSVRMKAVDRILSSAKNVLNNVYIYSDELQKDGTTSRGKGGRYAKMLSTIMQNNDIVRNPSSSDYYSGPRGIYVTGLHNSIVVHKAKLTSNLHSSSDTEALKMYLETIKKVNGLNVEEYTAIMMTEIIDKMFTIIMLCKVIAENAPVFNTNPSTFYRLTDTFDILPIFETLKPRKE